MGAVPVADNPTTNVFRPAPEAGMLHAGSKGVAVCRLSCCIAVAGASVPLILAGSASSEILGLVPVFKPVDPADIAADTNIPGITSLLVVNVYATFTPGDAAASVIALGHSSPLGIPMIVNVADGTFFQHPLGNAAHLSPPADLVNVPGINTLRHDSFVTIGRKLDNDPVFGADLTGIQSILEWTDTRLCGHAAGDASWFLAGFPPQGDAGGGPDNPPDRVLIGQFTVANPGPNAFVRGSMFVYVRHTNAAGVVEGITIAGFFRIQIPAPCPWDLSGDGEVNVADLLLLLADFGTCEGRQGPVWVCKGPFFGFSGFRARSPGKRHMYWWRP